MRRNKLESGGSQYSCKRCGYSSTIDRDSVKKCDQTPLGEFPGVRRGEKVTIYEYGWQNGTGANSGGLMLVCWTVSQVYPSHFGHRLRSEDKPLPPHTWCVWLVRQVNLPSGKTTTIEKRMTYADFCLWREGNREKLEMAGFIASEEPVRNSKWKFWKIVSILSVFWR